MKKNITMSILFTFLLLLFSGCASNQATFDSFVDPSFSEGQIRKIAMFPIRNNKFAPSEAQQINRKMAMAINQKNPNIEIMSNSEAIKILSDNDLTDVWARFMENYTNTGIPDPKVLAKIGMALGVDAILQGEIVNVFQQDGKFAFGGNKGITKVSVRFSMLGTKSGKLLWEASSEGFKDTATTLDKAPPIIEVINLAIDKIVSNLPF